MQGFPQAAPPMSAGSTPPVAAVGHVGGVSAPSGVTPSITQVPTPGVQSQPYYGAPGGQFASATYPPQGGAPWGAPPIMPTPGPATLGPAAAGGPAAGGVAGVSMSPVTGVMPPAAPGGPHPLPGMPQLPLPQGFPNPFQIQQLGQQPQPGAGVQTVTGPQGYMPGIGYFGSPPQAGRPPVPGPAAGTLPGMGMPPAAFHPAPGMPSPYAAAAPAQGAPAAGATAQAVPHSPAGPPSAQPSISPFWLQLAWQLLQTPQTREALGDSAGKLADPANLNRTIQVAAASLQTQEMQAAFRDLTQGKLEQTKFLDQFAAAAQKALKEAGLV